jgi:hypothetical protein
MSGVPSGVAEGQSVVACCLAIGSRHTGTMAERSQKAKVWTGSGSRKLSGGAPGLVRIGDDDSAKRRARVSKNHKLHWPGLADHKRKSQQVPSLEPQISRHEAWMSAALDQSFAFA